MDQNICITGLRNEIPVSVCSEKVKERQLGRGFSAVLGILGGSAAIFLVEVSTLPGKGVRSGSEVDPKRVE